WLRGAGASVARASSSRGNLKQRERFMEAVFSWGVRKESVPGSRLASKRGRRWPDDEQAYLFRSGSGNTRPQLNRWGSRGSGLAGGSQPAITSVPTVK